MRIVLFFLLIKTCTVFAQEPSAESPRTAVTVDYKQAQTYEIGGIEVKGAVYTDVNGVISVSGLEVGEMVRIPSDQIGKAIRQLWKQGLFVDVQIHIQKTIADLVFLEIQVEEYPRFARHRFKGIPKGQEDDANAVLRSYLKKGLAATPSMQSQAIRALKDIYIEKGFLDVRIEIEEQPDPLLKNAVQWIFNIQRGKKVRIGAINFYGVEQLKKGKLYRAMKATKRNNLWALLKPSKFIKKAYEKDKQQILKTYNEIGCRDAKILKDSVYWIQKKHRKVLNIDLHLQEGNLYRFGQISFKGNTIYSDKNLQQLLGINKGDLYNSELLQSRLDFDKNGRDISTLYMDNGHLFFRIEAIEKGIRKDSIDMEIRISEGPIATIGTVTLVGNTRTSDHVILRELRTLPGEKFSRSDVIRSQRQLMNLNLFNPETFDFKTKVNPAKGTVDLEYILDEKPTDQVELAAGWGGTSTGLTGTVGVTLTNFSLRKFFQKDGWTPLPYGDGQRLSIRAQTNGKAYQSYNFSFTEPWLGGKKPNSLTLSAYYSNFTNGYGPESSTLKRLQIAGATLGWGTPMHFPDDNFVYQLSLNYKNMNLLRWDDLNLPTGTYHNLNIKQTISRNTLNHPIFPTRGSNVSLSLGMTLPYSLFSNKSAADYADMDPAEKFRMVEYFKFDFETEWYGAITKRLIVKLGTKMGYLGSYNPAIGLSPFDRYELGGDGLSNGQAIQGRDVISLRGYQNPVTDVSMVNLYGGAIYNKHSLELRYLISPNPSATIWVLAFAEAGNIWADAKTYNPFDLKRSVGAGVRIFLPMFGTLGFDYGFGFDKPHLNGSTNPFDYGSFNIILGVQPK